MFTRKIKKMNFEDVLDALKTNIVLINTLPVNQQECLIQGTIPCELEETKINEYLRDHKK